METHLAKSRRVSRTAGAALPHVFTTSYLTHAPTEEFLARQKHYGYEDRCCFRPASRGLAHDPDGAGPAVRLGGDAPTILDEQQQKVRDSLRHALIGWARSGRGK